MTYESPTITEIGSIADFTRGDGRHREFDGIHFLFGLIPVPDLTGPGS